MKRTKRIFALVLSVVLALSLFGCSSNKTPGNSENPGNSGSGSQTGDKVADELIVLAGADASTFDPHFCSDSATEIFLSNIYNGLVKFNTDMEIVPDLASEWSISEDGLTWTFKLREGVKFHDGTDFNAEAVKISFDRIVNPDTGSPVRSNMSSITQVDVVDEYTVNVTTSFSNGSLLQKLARVSGSIISPAALETYGDDLATHPVGTGPYKYVEWKVGEEIALERNEDYFEGAPMVQNLYFRVVPEDATRALLLQSGQADIAMRLPVTEVERLRGQDSIGILEGDTVMTMYVALNNSKGVLQDVKVRQAMNYAVDKDVIVNDILDGMATVADSPISTATWGYSSTMTYAHDVEKAKSLLAEAGYPDGIDLVLWTPAGRYLMDVQVAENLQAQWAEANIRVSIRQWEFQSLMSEVKKGEFDMVLLGWSPSDADADTGLYRVFHSSQFPPNSNRAFYNNPKADKLLEDAQVEVDFANRAELYKQAQQIIMDEAAWTFLYYPKQALAFRSNISGIEMLANEYIRLGNVVKN